MQLGEFGDGRAQCRCTNPVYSAVLVCGTAWTSTAWTVQLGQCSLDRLDRFNASSSDCSTTRRLTDDKDDPIACVPAAIY
jgi:hypothetical protein